MPASTYLRATLRGALSALVGALVVFAYLMVQKVPAMFSPSEPPTGLGDLAIVLPIWFAACALLLAFWLVPGCAVTRFIATSRGVRGLGAAAVIGGLAAVVSFGTIYFLPSVFEWPPVRPQVLGKLPIALSGAVFALAWFLGFELLPPRPKSASAEGAMSAHRMSVSRLAIRIVVETLAVVAVVAYAAILGGIAGGFVDFFGGDDEYTVKSVFPSPTGEVKAYSVVDITPGGALGDLYQEVYVLPSAETWTAERRGLLLWRAENVEVLGVEWASAGGVHVRVKASDYRKYAERIGVFSREGYQVSTEPTSGS